MATVMDRTVPAKLPFTTTHGFAVNPGYPAGVTIPEPVGLAPSVAPSAVPSPFAACLAASAGLSKALPAPVKPSSIREQARIADATVEVAPYTKAQLAAAAPPISPASGEVQAGWQGLLEISRASGASGILGCRASQDEDPYGKDTKIEICCTAHTNNNVRRMVKSVIRGLKACQEPEKTNEGMGGTYFFSNENGRKVAIMKPCDEEPLAPNNPKGYVGRALGEPGWKPTVRVGEAAMREVAAYLLDHDGFAKVPTSVLVRARHPIFCYNSRMSSVRQSSIDLTGNADAPCSMLLDGSIPGLDSTTTSTSQKAALPMKLGSLQEFVAHECDTSEMGPSRFSVSDVHRIGILDIRLFNTDRHAGNMLVRRPARDQSVAANLKSLAIDGNCHYELIPIDHGFCLPETLEACYFEWLHWPQAMLPFTEEELAYIDRIDIEADKELLRKELPNLRPECLRVMEMSTTLLKKGAAAGLTLYDIASVMTRPYEGGVDEEPSELEKTAAYAKKAAQELGLDAFDDDDNADHDHDLDDDTIDELGEDDEEYSSDDGFAAADSDVDEGSMVGFDHQAVVGKSSAAHAAAAAGGAVSTLHQRRNPGSPLRHVTMPDASGLKQAGSLNEDSMLFELDDDGTVRSGGLMMSPHSPGAASVGSSISSVDRFSSKYPSMEMSTGTPVNIGAPRGLLPKQPNTPTTPFAQLASSVHVTDGGFLWRRMKSRTNNPKRHKRPPGGKLAFTRLAYPPPVMAFAPDSLVGLFTDMDEKQWRRYLSLWCSSVDAALLSGEWKHARLPADVGGVAQSCPRF